jgi:hypothetical protein
MGYQLLKDKTPQDRLFWKFFLAFLLAQVLAGGALVLATNLFEDPRRPGTPEQEPPWMQDAMTMP